MRVPWVRSSKKWTKMRRKKERTMEVTCAIEEIQTSTEAEITSSAEEEWAVVDLLASACDQDF